MQNQIAYIKADEDHQKTTKGTYRWWFLTYNNPPENWREVMDGLRPDYSISQLEEGGNGTKHIQGCLYYTKAVRASHFKGFHAWIKGISTHDAANVVRYCKKNQTRVDGPYEIGHLPKSMREGKDWGLALNLAKEGRILEISPEILIPYFASLQKICAISSSPIETQDVRGVWVFGKPGHGKSHLIRANYSPLYIKPQNKWFDGYMGEPYILLDDFDEAGKCLGHYLKIWADKWKCYGEIKGATVALKHQKFAITSNYLPDNFWEGDMLEAIKRRFRILEVENRQIISDSLHLNPPPNIVYNL